MTIGIYVLRFAKTSSVYVGQSVCIEKRFINHLSEMKSNSSSKKLQDAFNTYGVPNIEIICSCAVSELNTLEKEAIEIFDSVKCGFNTLASADSYFGEQAPGAKYSNEQYSTILELLVYTAKSCKEIASITGTSETVVKHISDLSRHQWLADTHKLIYAELVKLRGIGTKNCAAARGKIYPKILSPDGVEYEVSNATAFSKEHNLQSGPLCSVLNGMSKSHKGWHLQSTDISPPPPIRSPDGTVYNIPYRGTKPFAIAHGLHPSDFAKVLAGKSKSHKGWTLV